MSRFASNIGQVNSNVKRSSSVQKDKKHDKQFLKFVFIWCCQDMLKTKKSRLGQNYNNHFNQNWIAIKFVYLVKNKATPICYTSINIIKDAQSYFDSLTLAFNFTSKFVAFRMKENTAKYFLKTSYWCVSPPTVFHWK